MIKKGKIFIISGPSGSGKTTLYKKLLAHNKKLVKSISVTTRPRRPGERHGRDYYFVSLKKFLYMKRAGHFLESQKVFDNYYGTPYKNVNDLLKRDRNILLCIDVKGAQVVCQKFPTAVSIFIKTPSMAILRKRLKNRTAGGKDNLRLRLETARKELREAKNYDYIVVNDQLKVAYQNLKAIVYSKTQNKN